jgi:hypothetical protein
MLHEGVRYEERGSGLSKRSKQLRTRERKPGAFENYHKRVNCPLVPSVWPTTIFLRPRVAHARDFLRANLPKF